MIHINQVWLYVFGVHLVFIVELCYNGHRQIDVVSYSGLNSE